VIGSSNAALMLGMDGGAPTFVSQSGSMSGDRCGEVP
jgi:hypothetical protein